MLKRLDLLKRSNACSLRQIIRLAIAGRGRSADRGAVSDVERSLADLYGLSAEALRRQLWRNLRSLALAVGVGAKLPREFRRHLAAA